VRKAKHPFSRSVLVAATIGVILGVILGIIFLKYTVSGWEDIFLQLIFTLFFFGVLLGLVVALKTGGVKIFAQDAKPEALALPIESSWVLTALALVWGIVGGILVSLALITQA
jgi:ABC-type lipoprotein release transport system permease subunit